MSAGEITLRLDTPRSLFTVATPDCFSDTANAQLGALRREGLRALVIGFVMLAAGLALSQATSNSGLPESLRVFFGDGVFLVAAWVGIWYPLDTLIYTPGPLRRDRQVLEALLTADVVVQAT